MRDNAKDPERHAARMAKKKRAMEERMARATEDKGVLVVLTGSGKGKSSSGFGMAARALGHGMQVGIVQFIKGAFATGEERFFREQPNVTYHVMGEGYTWDTQDREKDVEAAQNAWKQVQRMLQDDSYGLVLLDELSIRQNLAPITHLTLTDTPANIERKLSRVAVSASRSKIRSSRLPIHGAESRIQVAPPFEASPFDESCASTASLSSSM